MDIIETCNCLGQQLTLGTCQQSTLLPKGGVNRHENCAIGFLKYNFHILMVSSNNSAKTDPFFSNLLPQS
jgi:hypothetical protein